MASVGGRYLGDPVFDPLNRRRAVVFVHPDGLPDGDVQIPGVDEFIADFLLDTTRAALSLIASGTLDRYRDLSIILAHAGGFLPYAAGRVESAGRQGEGPDPAAVRAAQPGRGQPRKRAAPLPATRRTHAALALSLARRACPWHRRPRRCSGAGSPRGA
ncbi:hypothetical protein GCM10023170_076770 [Phytohabitans houttuyneae]